MLLSCGPGGQESSIVLLPLPTVLLLVLGMKLSLHTWHLEGLLWCGAADGQSGSSLLAVAAPTLRTQGRGAHLCASESGARHSQLFPALRDTSRASALTKV